VTGTAQPADDAVLLPLLIACEMRNRQAMRKQTLLLFPYPDCHQCGKPVTALTGEAEDSLRPPWRRSALRLEPCGHTVPVPDDGRQLLHMAREYADSIENRPAGTQLPDWLRGGICRQCGGTPVVYRNYRDQPFCASCSTPAEGAAPELTPASTTLRDQIAVAIDAVFERWTQGLGSQQPQNALTEAVMAACDIGMEQLRTDLDRAREALIQAQAEATSETTRAERAEAALDRVRAALDDLCHEPHPSHDHVCPDDVRRHVLAALDEPKEQP
jgi:hypothetical protein